MKDRYNELQTERQKLNSLVDEALERGTPISEAYDIMAQCAKIRRLAAAGEALIGEEIITQSRKVDGMVVEAEREREESE